MIERFRDERANCRPGLGPLPVLVVDDLAANRWVLGKLLGRLGIGCRFASDGTEAIAVAGMRRWGAFLMDIEMRRLDGDQAARQLRRLSPYLAGVPIIAVTSLPVPAAIKRCRRGGIDGLVSKPVSIEALEKQLRTHAGHLFGTHQSAQHPAAGGDAFHANNRTARRLEQKPSRRQPMPHRGDSDRSSETVG